MPFGTYVNLYQVYCRYLEGFMKIVIVLLNGREKRYSCNGYGWNKDKSIIELYNKNAENYATIHLSQIAYWYIED